MISVNKTNERCVERRKHPVEFAKLFRISTETDSQVTTLAFIERENIFPRLNVNFEAFFQVSETRISGIRDKKMSTESSLVVLLQ